MAIGADFTVAEGDLDLILTEPQGFRDIFEAFDGEERQIVETEAGGFFAVLVERIEPEGLQPFETVRDRVVAD